MSLLPLLAIGMPQGFEWIIILVVALLIFGPKLPSILRGLGGSVREFKKGMNEDQPTTAVPLAPPAPAETVSRVQPPVAPPTKDQH